MATLVVDTGGGSQAIVAAITSGVAALTSAFALVLPDLKPFVAFAIADVAVFVTRFWFFEELAGGSGTPQWLFEVAVGVRAVVLLWCLGVWLVRDADALVLGWRAARSAAPEVQLT